MNLEQFMVGASDGEAFDFYNNTVTMRDGQGQLVRMDLGTPDVHIDHALANYLSGYSNGELIADVVAPPVVVGNQSNFFFQFDPDNALATVDNTAVASNGDYPTITPALSSQRYNAQGYALGSLLPLELLGNQDAPLNIARTATKMVMDRLMLNREVRVKNLVFNSGAYATANLLALTAGQKWNGGASSDPVRNIRQIIEASLMPPTHMAMSRSTWHAFTENPAVQKYTAFKSGAAPLPQKNQYESWAALLDMPIPVVAEARAKDPTQTRSYPYVWNGSVVLFRMLPGNAQVTDADVTTAKTFRWNGAGGPNLPTELSGAIQGGITVRSFFNPYKGRRGTQTVVVTHDDAEVMTGGTSATSVLVGGLITGAFV